MQAGAGNPITKNALRLFIVATIADITGIAFNTTWLHYSAKPLLLPLLIIATAFTTPASLKMLFITALFFSWAGDLFLLFESSHALFFIFGLASFLTTHILYIVYFIRTVTAEETSLLKQQPWLAPVVVLYGAGLVWLLFPYLGTLKIPVIVYAAVICSMLLSSLHIYNRIPRSAAILFASGALLFVLSDSLLAINKFYTPLPYGGVWVMLTYCAAQFNIVNGFIKCNQHDKG
ncbi:MAG: lysoplasmalogenase [Ferruginibacter sp.]